VDERQAKRQEERKVHQIVPDDQQEAHATATERFNLPHASGVVLEKE
jgi:hypothetical protein